MHGIVEALCFAACLSHYGRNPSEVERLASDLIELSTRQNFAPWLARGIILRGWARSASGDTAQGISWIEDGIEVWRATGAMLCMPFFLALKAEAFYLVDRTSEALEAVKEAERLAEKIESAGGVPNCTGSGVCFSRLWVLRRTKLRIRSAMPSEPQRSRIRFHWRNAQKQPTRNTAPKSKRFRRTWIPTTSLLTPKEIRKITRNKLRLPKDCPS